MEWVYWDYERSGKSYCQRLRNTPFNGTEAEVWNGNEWKPIRFLPPLDMLHAFDLGLDDVAASVISQRYRDIENWEPNP